MLRKADALRGMGVALITPFLDNGDVDYESLRALVDYQIERGADFIVVLGTTGESATLSADERAEVSRAVVDATTGRIPLVIGIGGNCTRTVVDEINAADLHGYSAILSVVPFYSKPTQEGIYRHFACIAEHSPLPILLYNVPGRTGVNMLPDTALRLANDYPDTIIGIKEASGNIQQAADIIDRRPKGFIVLSGNDDLTVDLIERGADGVISVMGNALPIDTSAMTHFAMQGDYTAAKALSQRLIALCKLLFVDGNPAGVKCLLYQMGLIHNCLRLPLVPATDATASAIADALLQLSE